MEKKFWHQLTEEEVQAFINKGLTCREMDKIYKIPDWCNFEHPFCKDFHWCDNLLDQSTRSKISIEYCKNCSYFKGRNYETINKQK